LATVYHLLLQKTLQISPSFWYTGGALNEPPLWDANAGARLSAGLSYRRVLPLLK